MNIDSRAKILLSLVFGILAFVSVTTFLIDQDQPGDFGHPRTPGCIDVVEAQCAATENQSSFYPPGPCLDADEEFIESYERELENDGYQINSSRVRCLD